MSRIPVVERADAGPEVNASYDALEAMGFPLLNVLKMFGNHAGMLDAFSRMAMALYENPKLEARYRELAYLRASQINAGHY